VLGGLHREGCLAQIHLARDPLHQLDVTAVENDAQPVPFERPLAEYIDDPVAHHRGVTLRPLAGDR